MPSSFSLISHPVGSCSVSHLWARSTGGAVSFATAGVLPVVAPLAPLAAGLLRATAVVPTRAASAPSPRYARRCLQLRASSAAPWLRHAGHVQAYTSPVRLIVYFADEPWTSASSPSASVLTTTTAT